MDPIPERNMIQSAAVNTVDNERIEYTDLALKYAAKIRKEEARREKYREQSHLIGTLYKTSTTRHMKIHYLKLFMKAEQKYFYHMAQLGKARHNFHDEILRVLDPSDE